MEKEYLIHNIDYKDNPEDQHQIMDITISDLEIAGQDITADIGIDTYLNGISTHSSIYEDVSLTGSGGGGVPTAAVSFTITNNGSPIQETVVGTQTMAEETSSDGTYINMGYGHAVTDSTYELLLLGEAKISQITFFTEDNRYIWSTGRTGSVISGDARIGNDSFLYINGDCELLLNTHLD